MKNERIFTGIDPGNELSAYIMIGQDDRPLIEVGEPVCGKVTNKQLRSLLLEWAYRKRNVVIGIEMVACYGMAVGKTVFETARWVGIFQEAAKGLETHLVYRKSPNKEDGIDSVCMHLCNST